MIGNWSCFEEGQMKKIVLLLAVAWLLSGGNVNPSPAGPESDPRAEAVRWFREARFGMFIHWGVYSVLGRGEWVMQQAPMSIQEYEKLPPQFNPVKFDAAHWVSLAKRAGARYITITSKHHDGFAMWDSQVSDYDIVDRTPYGKDVLKALADECQRQGIKLFFYYSHLDWHHPDYYPRGMTGQHSGRADSGDFNRYIDYMNAQIAELAGGRYGDLAGFWFDGWWDQQIKEEGKDPRRTRVDWRLGETYDLIHRLQPQALIGNNHHVPPFPGEDFQMFEKDLPGANTTGFSADSKVSALPLETCETINGSWGYNRDDHDYKSSRQLVQYLVRAAGHDANFLLNVGPTPEGEIQPEFEKRLLEIGDWLGTNSDSIRGTRGGPMPPQSWGVMTHRPGRVFVHILDAEAPRRLRLPGTADLEVAGAGWMGEKGEIKFTREEGDLALLLPEALGDPESWDKIVELTLK